jgi:hypothetical protein
MIEYPIPPDDYPPEDVEWDLLEGLHANSMILDAKRICHLHPDIKFDQALQIIVISNQMIAREGPLFLHSMEALEDDEED